MENALKPVVKIEKANKKMRHSALTIKGKIERFLTRNVSPQKLQALYDSLTAKEKLQFLVEIIPYSIGKKQAGANDIESLSEEQIEILYNQIVKAAQVGKAS